MRLPGIHNVCSCWCRWYTQWCFQDVILLCSNEDNPQVTDPVRVIATIIFQLCFLKERIKIQGNNNTGHLSTINIDKQSTISTKFMINLSSINHIIKEVPLR